MSMIEFGRPSPSPTSQTAAPHPEEMRASFNLAIGRTISVAATARTTPAGLIATAALLAAIFVPLAIIARSRASAPARR